MGLPISMLITRRRCLTSHKPRDSAVGSSTTQSLHFALFCTRPDLARGRARQACPILVYYDRVVGAATPRYICRGRQKTEGRANARVAIHVVGAHMTMAAHIERTVRKVHMTGNCPFIKPHIHPIHRCY